jgi:hypothetical protein
VRALLLVALACCSLETDPDRVTFGGIEYEVRWSNHCLIAHDMNVRCLGEGTLIAFDFTGDDVDDLAVYTDNRDGFRRTFSYLEIWRNDGAHLTDATSETAKWKEGHWAWIDPDAYPGLRDSKFRRFMRARDDAHY